MSKKEYSNFVLKNYKKNELLVFISGFLIVLFEVIFAVINLLDNTRTVVDNIYLFAYLFLFVVTLVIVTYCLFYKKHEKLGKFLPVLLHIYAFAISVWAFTISFLEIYQSSVDAIRYPIVFITVLFALPFFLRLHWSINTGLSLAGFIAILVYANIKKGSFLVGYTSNVIVAAFMIVLVTILSYRTTLKNLTLENTLKELSIRDRLTNLFNRRALDDKLFEISSREDAINIIMVDCDNFKQINDKFGHRTGDKVLVKISSLLQENFGDECYRFGGDEFIVTTDLDSNRIIEIIASMNIAIKEAFNDVPVSVTAGVYTYEKGVGVASIIKYADAALYKAKNTQKGTVEIYSK